MQVIKKEKQMKEVDVTIESYTLCDKCNEKIKTGSYDSFECEFIHKTGSSYPEGGSGEQQEMELCQKCAVELVDLLRANGYRVNDSEWDW
jgi:NMD protein affecting ribosome stability and mRNA decay